MASATVSIIITDTANHSLVDIREKLLVKWNYLSGGNINWSPTGTAQDKLNFIEAYTAKNWFKKEYIEQLANEAAVTVAAAESEVDIQQGV